MFSEPAPQGAERVRGWVSGWVQTVWVKWVQFSRSQHCPVTLAHGVSARGHMGTQLRAWAGGPAPLGLAVCAAHCPAGPSLKHRSQRPSSAPLPPPLKWKWGADIVFKSNASMQAERGRGTQPGGSCFVCFCS